MTTYHTNVDEKNHRLCYLCDKPCSSKHSIRIHIKYDHFKQKEYPCEECSKSFKAPFGLTKHYEEVHEKYSGKEYLCDKCDMVFKSSRKLYVHRTNEHGPGSTCNYCGKYYRLRSSFLAHIKIHEAKKGSFVCDECGKEYDREDNLKQHKKIHAEPILPGEFVCPIKDCGKDFGKQSSLKNHIKNCHSDKQRTKQCGFCPMMFFNFVDKKAHEKTIHLNIKDLKCDQCDFATARRSHLTTHIRSIHEGETFSCDFPGCDKSYNLKRNLTAHRERVHKIPREKTSKKSF